MRKKLITLLTLSILARSSITAQAGTITKVYLNNNKLMLQQSPINKEGTVYVPLRSLENIGANIAWDAPTQTATIQVGYKTIQQRIGSNTASVNSKAVQLPGAAFLENGTTYVPIRFVSETIGAEISFEPTENSVYINYKMPQDDGQQYDNFGRLVRTDNLPSTADQFLYIAEGVPNEMYELPLEYELADFFVEGRHYVRPINMPSLTQYFRDETVAQWQDQFEEYLDLVLNLDYRNIPTDYAHNVASCYSSDRYLEGNTGVAEEFIKYAKDKQLVIEGDYYVEPSTTYLSWGRFTQRAWVKFIIKSDTSSTGQMVQDIDDELKTNVWYQGYIDINVGSNNNGSDGTDMIISYRNITTSTMLDEIE